MLRAEFYAGGLWYRRRGEYVEVISPPVVKSVYINRGSYGLSISQDGLAIDTPTGSAIHGDIPVAVWIEVLRVYQIISRGCSAEVIKDCQCVLSTIAEF